MLEYFVMVFDFDGVIINSIDECLLVSYCAYHSNTIPDSTTLGEVPNNAANLFRKYRYLVAPAREYFYLWKTIFSNPEVTSIEEKFLSLKNNSDQAAINFEKKFFQLRENMRKNDEQRWIKLNPVYPDMAQTMTNIASKMRIYVSSTKDRNSILYLTKVHELPINEQNIFGREEGIDKYKHLKEISRKTKCRLSKIIFIDDNYNHLIKLHKIGVKCYLAGWGYNSQESIKTAAKQGIPVIREPKLLQLFLQDMK